MLLEAHLTLSLTASTAPVLDAWLEARRDLRRIDIQLADGATRDHVMLTARPGPDLSSARRTLGEIRSALAALGVPVIRTKVEAAITDDAPPPRYIEHHVKVRLDRAQARALASAPIGAHVSRNPRRSFADHEERFLTQRFAAGATARSNAALADLLAELAALGSTVLRVERELVLLDDNLSLDAGWATEISR